MQVKKLFEQWDIKAIKLKTPFMEMEWQAKDEDRDAAWELYVEMLTRVITQPLAAKRGVEKTALESVYQLFPLTREILKKNGRHCANFTKIAVVVLNQIVRPFTTKWHLIFEVNELLSAELAEEFRTELTYLQIELRKYAQMLASIADVEDLTEVASTPQIGH
jgi:signal transduction histidine kinase